MWRLQNDMAPVVADRAEEGRRHDDQPSFTEITLDVRPKKSPACRRTCAASEPPMSATLHLAEQLISRRSVTPDDAGCQALIAERLRAARLRLRDAADRPEDVARHQPLGACAPAAPPSGKLLVFAGHTDVVPTGPLEQWTSDPFVPTHRDGKLYGRGAADMKTSIAALVVAVEEFVAAAAATIAGSHRASCSPATRKAPRVDGTVAVCDTLAARGERLDYCIVGEPTSVERLGDMIKNGRRGTL